MNPWLVFGLSLYAILGLGSMATMSIGVAIALACIIVGLGGPARAFSAMREELSLPDSRAYLGVSALLAAALAISLIAALLWPLEYGGHGSPPRFLPDMAKAWYLFLPIFVVTGLRRLLPAARSIVLRSWLIMFGLLSFFGIVQYFIGWPKFQMIPGNEPRYHATLFFGHHLSTASILIFPFFAALDLCRSRVGPFFLRIPRGVLIAFALAGVITLLATYSRTLWVAFPAGLVLWGLLALPRKAAVGAFVALGLGLAAVSQIPAVQRRITDPHGTGPRQELWRLNLQFLKDRPLTGTGWHHNHQFSGLYQQHVLGRTGQQIFSGHAHNNFLDMLGGTGIIGTLAWALWCLYVLRILRQPGGGRPDASASERVWPERFARGLACAWLVFHINGLTQVNFWESKVLHQMMWIVAWSLLWREQGRAEGRGHAA